MDTVIKNGTVVTASETCQAEIGIEEGKIALIGRDLDGEDDDRFWGQPLVVGHALRAFVTGQHRAEKAKPADEQ